MMLGHRATGDSIGSISMSGCSLRWLCTISYLIGVARYLAAASFCWAEEAVTVNIWHFPAWLLTSLSMPASGTPGLTVNQQGGITGSGCHWLHGGQTRWSGSGALCSGPTDRARMLQWR